jgi:hypothetical protein
MDRTFILLVIGFGLLGGLTLLSYSADVIKLHHRQMELMLKEKKRKEELEAARQAALEARPAQESQPGQHSPRKMA